MKTRIAICNLFFCALIGCGTNPGSSGSSPGPENIVLGCSDSCEWANDGVCDDGGHGAEFDGCGYGTDCADCGIREDSSKPEPMCQIRLDCHDGDLCTLDDCVDGECSNIPLACDNGETCVDGACVECVASSDCDDDDLCTTDKCVAGECSNIPLVCNKGETCVDGACVECVADQECDDSLFCNGWESCEYGQCIAGDPPCDAGEECDEGFHECSVPDVSTVDEILDASWLIVAYNSGSFATGTGSAFAVGDNLLATNAHVVKMVANVIQLGGSAIAYQHETGYALAATAMWIHPDYTGAFSPDVGVIEVGGTLSSVLTIADDDSLHSLQVFDDVRLSGFPGELVEINLIRPRATMLSGHITAMRPFDQSADATAETAMLIQHDMPTTPGTSGSPVVNELGEVIALHNSAARGDGQSNFAIRADALSQLLGLMQIGLIDPVDLALLPVEPAFDDGQWRIVWDVDWPDDCLLVESGFVTFWSFGCEEWVDVVDVEILYDDPVSSWGWPLEDGRIVRYALRPIADEQFSVGFFVDDELIATGLMTR